MVAMSEIQDRVHAAVLTANFCSARVGPRQPGSCMPEYLYEAEDLEEGGWRNAKRSRSAPMRFEPTPGQLDDMLVALAWLEPYPREGLAKLERWEWSGLYARAHQEWLYTQLGGRRRSWSAIAKRMRGGRFRINRSDEWWRQWHAGVIRRAAHIQQLGERASFAIGNLAKSGQNVAIIGRAA